MGRVAGGRWVRQRIWIRRWRCMWGDATVAINIPSDRPVHVYIHTGQATLRAAECEAMTTNADATAYMSNGGEAAFVVVVVVVKLGAW